MNRVPFCAYVTRAGEGTFERRSNVPLEDEALYYGFSAGAPQTISQKRNAKFERRGRVEDKDYADLDLMVVHHARKPEGMEVIDTDADYVLVSPNGSVREGEE